MRHWLRSFRQDCRGSATIELALVMPLLGAFLMGAADVSMAVGRKLILEQSVQRGIERVMQTTTTTTVEANIKAEVSEAAGIPTSDVTVVYYLTCNGTATAYSSDCTSGQTEVRYLTVTAVDEYEPMFTSIFPNTNSAGNIDIVAKSGIRTH